MAHVVPKPTGTKRATEPTCCHSKLELCACRVHGISCASPWPISSSERTMVAVPTSFGVHSSATSPQPSTWSLEPNSHSSINSNGTNLDTDQTEEHRVSSVSYKHDTAIEPSFGLYASSLSETINPRVPSGHHYSVADEPASTTSPPPI
ncbi:unnamed protein product [Miscanthus lutarioriparius]|uniref:Uncharacterized protein n=1 Tax=Miscanthus lutarioriparius TaxID=422564 RepID=A0A811N3G3_9POAL|nr:unnamed protein product [Miscanthus lutarioriparius]